MIQVFVGPIKGVYDEDKGTSIDLPRVKLRLEHSLISIAKWESKWKKPFLSKNPVHEKTNEEVLDYIRCMTVGEEQPYIVYASIDSKDLIRIKEYIEDPQTATTIHDIRNDGQPSSEYDTSETLYYKMFKLGIPLECEKWHINRLTTLMQVYGVKDDPDNKMSESEALAYQNKIMAERRAATEAAKAEARARMNK
jgi:hypothetical protein